MTIRIGTRSSRLALWQAHRVREELEKIGESVEIVHVKTAGDRNRLDPIGRIGNQGAFTKEIQRALLDGKIDLAVHSLKDLPTDPVPGLIFAATLDREDVSDLFLSRNRIPLAELPKGSRIGTGSLRRKCQLIYRLQGRSVQIDDIRGNVETRLKKLNSGEYDAIVLAAAGLNRLGFHEQIAASEKLNPLSFFPAVGQGALGLESREDDQIVRSLLAQINHNEVFTAIVAEREFLLELRGGCIAPIGAYCRIEDNRLLFDGRIISLDGLRQFDVRSETELSGGAEERLRQARNLGRNAAASLAGSEAAEILEEIRSLRKSS